MPDLRFSVEQARMVEYAATPEISLSVAISAPGVAAAALLLRCSVRIEASRREHDAAERERLRELFGGEGVWARSPKSLLWARTTSFVPGFTSKGRADVRLPCSYDLAAAAFRYLHGLVGGDVPITVQFSGTLFHRTEGVLEAWPIPWDREASFSVPLSLFRSTIDAHFPGAAVVGLGRGVFERLDGYRRERGLESLDAAVERLLATAERAEREEPAA